MTSLAFASGFVGEKMSWDVRYAGMVAGHANAEAKPAEEGLVDLEGRLRNADWYERLYSVNDWVQSTWDPSASRSVRYQTHFREGRFHQNQDMKLHPEGFSVWRRQKIDGEWKTSTTVYDGAPKVDDPVSAIYAMRRLEGDGPWTYPVFSGKKTWPLTVEVVDKETVDTFFGEDTPVVVYELKTLHEGDLEQKGRFFVYLTDDERRIPVKLLVKTNFGPIRADLVAYEPPGSDQER